MSDTYQMLRHLVHTSTNLHNQMTRLFWLRQYTVFKVRKLESLFYKINSCLQKTTTCIRLQTEQILSLNV